MLIHKFKISLERPYRPRKFYKYNEWISFSCFIHSLFRKFQGNCDSSANISACLFCFLSFFHYPRYLNFCTSEEKSSLKKKGKKNLITRTNTVCSSYSCNSFPSFPGHKTTQEFTIEFDKILVDTSSLYYSSLFGLNFFPPPPPQLHFHRKYPPRCCFISARSSSKTCYISI